jgi:hypothetical protein
MSHDYNLASEPDLKPSASRNVWYYFIILGLLLYITIYALDIFYRFTLTSEKEKKIGVIQTHEALDKKAVSQAYLSGQRGLFNDKNNISIEDAKRLFLEEFRRNSQ